MKVLKFLILTSIIAYSAARVVVDTKNVEAKKIKNKLQSKQEDDAEGVDVDPVIPVANIEVYEVTTNAATVSVEDISTEVSTSSAESTEVPVANEDDQNPINRYCKCTSFECDCCRDFSLPLVPIRGPGCANIRYLEGDRLSVGIKFGNRVLANRIVSGRKSTPVCLPLPGGFTNFCGRIYGISKKNENFKACLALELRADEEIEAALRVSCFDFGPRGLKVTEAEPIPASPSNEEDDDDDDDDDLFGLGSDDDDDDILGDGEDESEDDTPTGQSAGPSQSKPNNDDEDDDDTDYTGLSLLSGDFLEDILGDDDDDSSDQNRPVPSRKILKKKVPVTESSSQNEVDGTLNDGEEEEEAAPISRPIAPIRRPNNNDDDEDDDDEEGDGGIFGILDDLISDGDDDDDESAEEQLEDEVSEEIVQNELSDDVEEVAEEVDDPVTGSVKDAELENYDDQALEESVVDDDDDTDEDDEDLDDEKPSYSGLSLLGLRKFFSRFFH